MNVLINILAFIGAWTVLAIIGGLVFGVFFRGATAEDRATVDLSDVGDRVDATPWPSRPVDATNVRLLRGGERTTSHDPATCDACAHLDRSGF